MMFDKQKIDVQQGDNLILLKEIPNNSIDLVLTDPPYLISKTTNFQSGEKVGDNRDRFRISMNFGSWDQVDNNYDFETLFNELFRVLKPSGTIIVFWDLWKLQDLARFLTNVNFKQLRFIEWVKTNPVPINSKINYLTNAREIAITAVKKNKPTFHGTYDNGIYEFPIESSKLRFHPTQKSIKLFETLIKKHSNEGDVVLDCFLGGGTTAYACVNTNRNCIGFEIDNTYVEKTKENLLKLKEKKIDGR